MQRLMIAALLVVAAAAVADICDLPDDWSDVLSPDTRHAPFVLTQAYQNPPRERRRYVMRFVDGAPDMLIVVPREELPVDQDALRAARDIADQWARLPRVVHDLWPVGGRLELDFDAVGGLSYQHGGIVRIGYDGSPWPLEGGYDQHQPWTDDRLLHEAAHMLDADAGWFLAEQWAAAVAKDGDYVTDYARTNTAEDFAESFVGWALYRAYPHLLSLTCRRHTIATMTARIRYFDRRLWVHSLAH